MAEGADGSLEIGLMVFKPLSEPPLRSAQVHDRVGDNGGGDEMKAPQGQRSVLFRCL